MDLKLDTTTLANDVTGAVQHLLGEAAPQYLELKLESRIGKSLSVFPREASCAPFSVYGEDGDHWVHMTVGRNTKLEIPLNGECYTRLEGTREFFEVLGSLISVGFEETLWTDAEGRIVASAATLFVEGRRVKVRNLTLRSILGQSGETTRYVPYPPEVVQAVREALGGNMAGSNDPFKPLQRLRRSNPFWVGWSLGMLVGAVFLTFQWHHQADVPVADWVLEIGWPLIFHKTGGFSGLDEFYFWPFVIDFVVWTLISAVPGLLLRWLLPRIIK